METKSRLFFAEEKIRKEFQKLKIGKTEDVELHQFLSQAFNNLIEDAFCGIQIPKKLIPKEYIKEYDIDNLWKYNLPNAWRLLYSIGKEKVEILSIVLEWMDHKTYERRFKY